MLVYRVCDKEELSTIFKEKSLNNIGHFYIVDNRINSFNYKKNKKYLHFFKEYADIFYFDSDKRKYICIYDIDEDILKNSKGIGYYLDRTMFNKIERVEEFAIETDLISFDDLKQIDEIKDIILFEEYLDGSYQNKINTIYNKKNQKVLKKSIFKN